MIVLPRYTVACPHFESTRSRLHPRPAAQRPHLAAPVADWPVSQPLPEPDRARPASSSAEPSRIAKGLRIRRTLYVGPVILEERSSSPEVTAAIRRPRPDRRQKRVQIDIDETFRREKRVAAVGTVLRGSLPSTTTATARTPRRAGHPGSSPRVSKRAASARRRTQAAAQQAHSKRTSTRRPTDSVRRSHQRPETLNGEHPRPPRPEDTKTPRPYPSLTPGAQGVSDAPRLRVPLPRLAVEKLRTVPASRARAARPVEPRSSPTRTARVTALQQEARE